MDWQTCFIINEVACKYQMHVRVFNQQVLFSGRVDKLG